MQTLYVDIKKSFLAVENLNEAKPILESIIISYKNFGKTIGFVVGKITPTHPDETIHSNRSLLNTHTLAIEQLVKNNSITVFSAGITPESWEGKFPVDTFYSFFDSIVHQYAQLLYTTIGWQQSKGASNEVIIARGKKIPIWHYETGKLTVE